MIFLNSRNLNVQGIPGSTLKRRTMQRESPNVVDDESDSMMTWWRGDVSLQVNAVKHYVYCWLIYYDIDVYGIIKFNLSTVVHCIDHAWGNLRRSMITPWTCLRVRSSWPISHWVRGTRGPNAMMPPNDPTMNIVNNWTSWTTVPQAMPSSESSVH